MCQKGADCCSLLCPRVAKRRRTGKRHLTVRQKLGLFIRRAQFISKFVGFCTVSNPLSTPLHSRVTFYYCCSDSRFCLILPCRNLTFNLKLHFFNLKTAVQYTVPCWWFSSRDAQHGSIFVRNDAHQTYTVQAEEPPVQISNTGQRGLIPNYLLPIRKDSVRFSLGVNLQDGAAVENKPHKTTQRSFPPAQICILHNSDSLPLSGRTWCRARRCPGGAAAFLLEAWWPRSPDTGGRRDGAAAQAPARSASRPISSHAFPDRQVWWPTAARLP